MNKNKYTYVWVSLVILVFGIIFIPRIVNRIKTGNVVNNNRLNVNDNSGDLAYITLDSKKRKVPSFGFLNQDSLLITDKDYLGKVYLVEFFFTSCPSICPLMTKNLVAMQEEFKEFDNFGIASFTITPDHDTPAVLKAYAEKNGITDMDWHLLTGDKQAIYDLANSGFNIFVSQESDAPGGFEHSGLFALVDKKGYIRSRVDKFGNPLVYYRGAISEDQGANDHGETEQISLLKADIKKLLEE